MLTLLDTGRHPQARDRDIARVAARAAFRTAWSEIIPRVASDAPKMQRAIILASLTAAYDDAARGYHNLTHIGALLADVAAHGATVSDRDALLLAILFHDVVYDARRNDNEMASAALARVHLNELGAAAALVDRVARMVLATRHRADDEARADADTALLLDLDLAVLAAAPDHYRAYVVGVRREYADVPDDAWRTGRARILQSFLDRHQIYSTLALAALWEAKARANMADELGALLTN
jgi:predicted metal-dependent HD superfamily phosphohydrolase